MASAKQKAAMVWFKNALGAHTQAAIDGTPFTLDLITAIAVQESYESWGLTYKTLPIAEVLELCVGDSIGEPKRGAFPKTEAELKAYPGGQQLFTLARDYLKKFSEVNSAYKKSYKAGKFCHAFGIFQYDIQHFKTNPDYFLKKEWCDYDICLDRVVKELKVAQKGAKLGGKTKLTHMEMCFVAIVYNMGAKKFDPDQGLKQGHKDTSGTYYGEYIDDYLKAAKAIKWP
jgi:hypothetical protein